MSVPGRHPLDHPSKSESPTRFRHPRGPGRAALLAVASAALLAFSGCTRSSAPVEGQADPPVVLVESVPVETGLGHPGTARATEVWLELIRGARERLDFEEFYLSRWPGEPLDSVLDAIGEAAARGVRVRLLLDARMHGTYPEPADSLGGVPGIEVRTIDMGRIAGGVQHAKYFIVDDHTVFLGSQNMDWRALKHIHELGVRIRDRRVAAVFDQVFEMDWAAAGADSAEAVVRGLMAAARRDAAIEATGVPPEGVGMGERWPLSIVQAPGDTVRLWPSYSPRGFIPDSTLWDRDALVRLLDRAEREVVLQMLSYSVQARGLADSTLDHALRRAAARGVSVRLLVSDWQAGPRMEVLERLAEVPGIEVRLSVVPEWSGGYIPFARVEHCKAMVVDTLTTWIGTSNWGPDYFSGSRNVAVTLENRPLARTVRESFENSWNASGALAVRPGRTWKPRVHGEDPPPGARKHGG